MRKSKATWIVPAIVAITAGLVYLGTHFNIEEAANRHAVAVVWDDRGIAGVRCARFSNEFDANLIASDYSVEFPSNCEALENGDEISITVLLSGFNKSRILHEFVVAEIASKDGMVVRRLFRMTPEILENGTIGLGRLESQKIDTLD